MEIAKAQVTGRVAGVGGRWFSRGFQNFWVGRWGWLMPGRSAKEDPDIGSGQRPGQGSDRFELLPEHLVRRQPIMRITVVDPLAGEIVIELASVRGRSGGTWAISDKSLLRAYGRGEVILNFIVERPVAIDERRRAQPIALDSDISDDPQPLDRFLAIDPVRIVE